MVDLRLVRGVAVHARVALVPLQVVLVQVEHNRGVQRDVVHPVQLEAGELDGERVVGDVVQDGLDDGAADVADRGGLAPVGDQHRLQHLRGRGLAVGARDAEPRDDAVRLHHAPGQLRLAPHRHAVGLRLAQQRGRRAPAGRGDDQVGAGRQRRRRAPAEPDGDVEGLQQQRLVGEALGLVEHRHLRAERHQAVGRGEAGDAEARDDDGGLLPVREAVGGPHPVEGHCPTTHSA